MFESQFSASLWGDEGFSAILSMRSVPEIIKIISRDTSPPLYNITEHFWFVLFGTSESAIRSLSFLYFLVAVFFTFLIGKYLFDKRAGLIAAVLTFLNPFFFTYAFEGRMYSMLAAGAAASMYFFLKKKWLGYIAASLAALYTHHFSIFIFLVQGIIFFGHIVKGERQTVKYMFKAFLAVAIGYLPWIMPLYTQTKMVGGGFWLPTPNLNDLRKLLYDYLAEGIASPLARSALVLVFAALALRRWGKNIGKTAVLLLWFFVPILATWGISQFFQSVFFNRYLLYTIPSAMLILASQRRRFSIAAIMALAGMFFLIDFNYFTHPTKPPFRELASYVKETKKGDDFVVQGDSGNHKLWEAKYYGIPSPIYSPKGEGLPFFVGTALMGNEDIVETLPREARRIGLINPGKVEDKFATVYTKSEVREFGSLKFVWYEKSF